MSADGEIVLLFRVTGIEDRYSTLLRPLDEEYEIRAESAPEALLELVNHSGMWESLDMERPFTIELMSIREGAA
jgi:hypothetical protein